MGVYVLRSNETFIRCPDMDTLWVFELHDLKSPSDAMHAKNWHRPDYSVGPNLHINGLEVWDKVFRGPELSRLIRKLCLLRLTINREGVCFLNTAGIVDTSLAVGYYRLNDLFNWSEFGLGVLPSLPGRWTHGDIENGNLLVGSVDEKEFQEKEDEIQKFREKLSATEAELNSTKEEMKKKEDEANMVNNELLRDLENYKKQAEENQKELNHYFPEGCRDPQLDIVVRRRIPFLPQNIKVSINPAIEVKPPKFEFSSVFTPLDTDPLSPSTFQPFEVKFRKAVDFDSTNWWVIAATKERSNFNPRYVVYYGDSDSSHEIEVHGIPVSVPFPKDATWFSSAEIGMVRGIGLRFLVDYKKD